MEEKCQGEAVTTIKGSKEKGMEARSDGEVLMGKGQRDDASSPPTSPTDKNTKSKCFK